MDVTTKREYKLGLLQLRPNTLSLEGIQRCAEALNAHDGDFITVRLATGAQFTVPDVLLNLGVKVLDFGSIERCLDLDLASRYDLILVMV